MSISAELAKILKKAGVDPQLYDTERPGFRKDFKPSAGKVEPGERDLNKSTPASKPKHLDVGPLQQEGRFEDILKQLQVDPNLYGNKHFTKKTEPKSAPAVVPIKRKEEPSDKREKSKHFDLGPLQEDHGMGYSHNVSLPQDQNTMDKPTIGSLEEYKEPETRLNSIKSRDEDTGIKLVYHWTKTGTIGFEEFKNLVAEIIAKMEKKGLK